MAPRRLFQDAPYEGLVSLCKEPYPRVDGSLAAQDQEEGERQHGRQRGDEAGGANSYLSGGREEVTQHLSQLLPKIGELSIEPLYEPTEAVLLGEVLDVFSRPFGGLSRGVDELDKAVYLVDQ